MSEFNTERPLIMHIDLNSCFATVEQQARPMLRGKPIGIVNRATEFTALVTASYEAKAVGVKVGMRFREAKALCPGLIAIESDPPKYRYVYHKLLDIMREYSAHVTMKSIDEGVIDFHHATPDVLARDMVEIAHEIKKRLKEEIGVWMRCNIGIATNRFLAKTAAGLNKPDGLTVLTSHNLREVFEKLELTDLTGIAHRNERRLNSVGIYTPLEFLAADVVALQKVVFKSVVGRWWYDRLRGWEVDDVSSDVKRVGRQYVLERFDLRYDEILGRLHHLCESVGSRMRSQQKSARGIYVYGKSRRYGYWHSSTLASLPFYSDATIYALARRLFEKAPDELKEIGVHVYELESLVDEQISLFYDEMVRERSVTEAIDHINQRYGDRTIHSAHTLESGVYVRQKIPFGSTRYL
jgi:DNA polymerase IV